MPPLACHSCSHFNSTTLWYRLDGHSCRCRSRTCLLYRSSLMPSMHPLVLRRLRLPSAHISMLSHQSPACRHRSNRSRHLHQLIVCLRCSTLWMLLTSAFCLPSAQQYSDALTHHLLACFRVDATWFASQISFDASRILSRLPPDQQLLMPPFGICYLLVCNIAASSHPLVHSFELRFERHRPRC